MIQIPLAHAAPRPGLVGVMKEGVPRAYAGLFFSTQAKLGWYFIAVTLLVPSLGLAGLAGVLVACALGWWLGFDANQLRSGYLLFNPLLACITVAWLDGGYHFPAGVFITLWLGATLTALLLSTTLHTLFGKYVGLSSHSLAAVIVSFGLYLITYALYGPFNPGALTEFADYDLEFLPGFIRTCGQAFGSMLFMPLTLPGLLVMAGVLVVSRLTVIAGVAGLAAGVGGLALLGLPLDPANTLWCGFNFLLCGIALCVGYYTPSRSSLAMGVLAAFLCAPAALGLATALHYLGLSVSALPANLVIVVVVYALMQRHTPTHLLPNLYPASQPEISARLRLINAVRFPFLNLPALRLPFDGPRLITQGFFGTLTHRGAWSHALDFEGQEAGRIYRSDGSSLDQFIVYDTAVLAPCDGIVTRIVHTVADNPPGENNPDSNWGNFIVLYADAGFYVMLAHLKPGSVTVVEGQRVGKGAALATVGNSGRSPVPHLHLQAQPTALPGAATQAFCLAHYLEADTTTGALRYHTAGIPANGTTIQPPLADARFAPCLSGWLPGEYRYRVTAEHGRSWEETLVVDFDEAGCFRIRSRRYRAALRAFVKDQVFYCTDFTGSGESVLAYLAAGLARVPFIADTGVTWRDQVSAVPFHAAPSRWLHDTFDPFIGPTLLDFTYRFGLDPTPVVECEATTAALGGEAGHPCSIRTHLIPRHAAGRIDVRFGNDRTLSIELAGYHIGTHR